MHNTFVYMYLHSYKIGTQIRTQIRWSIPIKVQIKGLEFKSCVLLNYLYIKSNLQDEKAFASRLKLQQDVQ